MSFMDMVEARLDKNQWGASHGGSQAITGRAASIMGVAGYRTHGVDPYTGERRDFPAFFNEVAYRLLRIIASKKRRSVEPLYHGFSGAKKKFRAGQIVDLPLVATSGSLSNAAGYGRRSDSGNEGPDDDHSVFVFKTSTPMAPYSTNADRWVKEFGYTHSEAIVSGKFRVLKIEDTTLPLGQHYNEGGKGRWRNDVPVKLIHLRQVALFDPKEKEWKQV